MGLELASVMSDEIQEPLRVHPGAVPWGALISGMLYISTTLILLVSVARENINVLAGMIQAIGHLAQTLGVGWIGPPFGLLLSLAIAGSASAWIAGCAQISFVAGLDFRLPRWWGRVIRFITPHTLLLAFSSCFPALWCSLSVPVCRRPFSDCFR